jgi:hypothetical protein
LLPPSVLDKVSNDQWHNPLPLDFMWRHNMTSQRVFAALAFAILLAFMPLGATAAPITVPNFSFENPDVSDSFTSAGVVPDWIFASSFPGFGSAEVLDPPAATYTGAGGNNTPLPGSGHGGQLADINTFSGGFAGTYTLTTATDLTTVMDNTMYTLTVALGDRKTGTPFPVTAIDLLVNGILVASTSANAATIPDDTFTDFTSSFSTGTADALTGGSLRIRLRAESSQFLVFVSDFDNVRLDQTALTPPPVSEPSTLALLGLGLLSGTRMIRRFKHSPR